MLPRILTVMAVLVSLGLLLIGHWLTANPVTVVTLQASVPGEEGETSPGAGMRFDLLRRSARSLMDSLCAVDLLESPEQVVRGVEDVEREAFLRGAIERRGFLLSRAASRLLYGVVRARKTYMDHIAGQPLYADLLAAVRRVNGPLIDLPVQMSMRSVAPVLLDREAQRYRPDRKILFEEQEEAVLDDRTAGLHAAWVETIQAYDKQYYRELVERSIVTAALYREQAVASAKTDSLGRATFSPIPYGTYWAAGYYPQNLSALSRAYRVRLLLEDTPAPPILPPLMIWDVPLTASSAAHRITLTSVNAVSETP
jgi:hypothetical protein